MIKHAIRLIRCELRPLASNSGIRSHATKRTIQDYPKPICNFPTHSHLPPTSSKKSNAHRFESPKRPFGTTIELQRFPPASCRSLLCPPVMVPPLSSKKLVEASFQKQCLNTSRVGFDSENLLYPGSPDSFSALLPSTHCQASNAGKLNASSRARLISAAAIITSPPIPSVALKNIRLPS